MPSRYLTFSGQDDVHFIELSLPKSVDMYEFDRINEEISRATAQAPDGRWVLDVTRSEYVGSAILGVMVNLRQRIRNGGGKLAVCGLSEMLGKALRTCSLYNLFAVAGSRDDAVRLVKSLR